MAKKKAAPKIRPLGGKVLISRLEAEETTRGGIVLPDAAKEKPQKGLVLALGDGKLLDDGSRGDFQVAKGEAMYVHRGGGQIVSAVGQGPSPIVEPDLGRFVPSACQNIQPYLDHHGIAVQYQSTQCICPGEEVA